MPDETMEDLMDLYRRLQRYVGWTEEDAECMRRLKQCVAPAFESLVEDFYDTIEREPRAAAVIRGGKEQVARLKITLIAWLTELFSGTYDRDYVMRRWRVGRRHVEIGLDQVYTNAALARLRAGLIRVTQATWNEDSPNIRQCLLAMNRLLDLDLALIEEAYKTEYVRRRQQIERLATLGQVAGGIAHELRNPLNVVKTSVYYLLHARSATLEKQREHLRRIERQVGLADGIITALNDFAKLPVPELRGLAVDACLNDVVHDLHLPESVRVQFAFDPDLPQVLADRRQLEIVFRNLIRNARDAMPRGGTLTLEGRRESQQVRIDVRDTGDGIPADILPRIAEPLFSTKAKGIGLGLSIARAIIEKHGGELRVASQPGQGSTFSVILPAQPRLADHRTINPE